MKTLAVLSVATLLVLGFGSESRADFSSSPLLTYPGPAEARIVAQVSTTRQEMQLTVIDATGQSHVFFWKVSTGRSGYETPTGTWNPTWMSRNHISRTYDNAPMPFAVFFTGGYAVHATDSLDRLGHPASHGCVRLSRENAEAFFNLVRAYGKDNTTISIAN